MKTVFNNRELCHVWAQQIQRNGKGSNMFFEENKIYSYGYHFEIARIVKHNVILFTSRNYSHTTSKHKLYVRRAISDAVQVFEVPQFDVLTDNIKYYKNEIDEQLQKASRARSHKESLLRHVCAMIGEMKSYIETFQLETTEDTQRYFDMDVLSSEVMEELKKEDAIRAKKELAKRKDDIEKWKNGEGYSLHNVSEIYLRKKDDFVETSLGATVGLFAAKELLRRIRKELSVHGIEIGRYTVQGYSDGVLTVGCHKMKIEEINRFATSQGW